MPEIIIANVLVFENVYATNKIDNWLIWTFVMYVPFFL